MHGQTHCESGFSLIELMVVVAVVGILAGVAYPSYTEYVRRSRLTEATAQLVEYRVRLEQYYQDNRSYGPANGACGFAVPTSAYFTFNCTVGAADTTYTAKASNSAGLGVAANSYVYVINQAQARTTEKFAGATVTKTCWLLKGYEC